MANEIFESYAAYVSGVDTSCRMVPQKGSGAVGVCEGEKTVYDLCSGGVTGFWDKSLSQAIKNQADKLLCCPCASESAAAFAAGMTALTACDSLMFAYDKGSAIATSVRLAREYSRSHYGEGRDGVIYAADEASLRFADAKTACALVFEPIDTVSGSRRNEEDLTALFTFAAENDLLVIADETSLGIYRTGSVTACAEYGLSPDVLLLGGLAGGLPMTVCLARGEAARISIPAPDGDPLLCAAAVNVLERFKKGSAGREVKEKAELLYECLNRCGSLTVVGATGLLASVKAKKYPTPMAVKRLKSRGILVGEKGGNILLLPPLAITKDQITAVCGLIDEILG